MTIFIYWYYLVSKEVGNNFTNLTETEIIDIFSLITDSNN